MTVAVRESWCLDTCDPADTAYWSQTNRARGQCGSTALVVNDLLGGELVLAEVLWPDGSRQGWHYWNRLPDGSEVDLTVEQFLDGEVVQPGRVVERPPGAPRRCQAQYAMLSERVLERLRGTRPVEEGSFQPVG